MMQTVKGEVEDEKVDGEMKRHLNAIDEHIRNIEAEAEDPIDMLYDHASSIIYNSPVEIARTMIKRHAPESYKFLEDKCSHDSSRLESRFFLYQKTGYLLSDIYDQTNSVYRWTLLQKKKISELVPSEQDRVIAQNNLLKRTKYGSLLNLLAVYPQLVAYITGTPGNIREYISPDGVESGITIRTPATLTDAVRDELQGEIPGITLAPCPIIIFDPQIQKELGVAESMGGGCKLNIPNGVLARFEDNWGKDIGTIRQHMATAYQNSFIVLKSRWDNDGGDSREEQEEVTKIELPNARPIFS